LHGVTTLTGQARRPTLNSRSYRPTIYAPDIAPVDPKRIPYGSKSLSSRDRGLYRGSILDLRSLAAKAARLCGTDCKPTHGNCGRPIYFLKTKAKEADGRGTRCGIHTFMTLQIVRARISRGTIRPYDQVGRNDWIASPRHEKVPEKNLQTLR